MRYVLFPVLHGIQAEEISDHFADVFVKGVRSYLSEEERDFFVPLPYNWTHNTQDRQMEIFERVEEGLWNQRFRRIKHTFGSDLVWYNRTKSGKGFFSTIHNDLDRIISEALQKYPDAPVAIFGHSLGSQIAFNYCWETEVKGLEVSGIFFAGSPFTMYSGMFQNWGSLPPNLKGFLVNFYNRMDIISSRIEKVHPSRMIADFVKDYEVPLSWNPLYWITLEAHSIYWESRFVWKTVARHLTTLINA